MMMRSLVGFVGVSLLLASEAAWACPSCFAEAKPAQREAYLDTTVLLSALPLLLLGFLALRLYQGSRRRDGRSVTEAFGTAAAKEDPHG